MRNLVFCIAVMGIAEPLSLWGQEPAPTDPTPTNSLNAPAIEIKEKSTLSAPLEEARQLFRKGEFEKALDRYNTIITGGTDDPAAYAGLVRVYLKLKKPDDAYSAATKALEGDPSLATTHSALGEVYFRQGRLPEARAEFLSALKLNQMDARAYLGLSRFYQSTFNFKKAKVAIDNAHNLDSDDPDISEAWVQTRPPSEQEKALETVIAVQSKYYSRAERANLKQRLAMMKDRTDHPERNCDLTRGPATVELPLRPILSNNRLYPGVGLDVRVNGQQARLVIALGGSGFVISQKIAKEAGVQPIVRADISGVGDQNPPEGYWGFSHSMQIGNVEFRNCYVFVVETPVRDSSFDRIKGTISVDLFSSYLMELNISDAKLELRPLPPRPVTEEQDSEVLGFNDPDAKEFHDRYVAPEMTAWEQLYNFRGWYVLPVRVNGSPPKLFEVSPAWGATVIAPELARQVTTLTKEGVLPGHGVNGRIEQTLRTGPMKLEFDEVSYSRSAESSIDLTIHSDKAHAEISGILGFDVLRNFDIQIDYRDGLIRFDNGEKRK